MAGLGWTANTRNPSDGVFTLGLTTSEKCLLEIQASSDADVVVENGHISLHGLSAGAAVRVRIVEMDHSSAGGDAVTLNHADARIDSGNFPHGLVAKRDPNLPTINKTHEVANITSGWSFGLRNYVIPRGKSLAVLAATSTGTATASASASGTV